MNRVEWAARPCPTAPSPKVLQSLASRGGYTGPIDGIPGTNTYAGLANLLD
ncbi:hypothetical protein [Pyxidicoccus trucidator]|uniref:hypothetical protein n=1 Tax=Pyxidicoccus trucidator TaxID=2709662 RepID=UPI0013D9B49A|nr:hypothetical protein [Pyxidicoccus trucidator]